MNDKPTLVVIGNGMVGQYFLAGLVNSDALARYRLVVFCEEPRPAYDRVHLSDFFAGKTAQELSLVSEGFFAEHGITVYLGDRAKTIDRERKIIRSENGVELGYQVLVLATGSYPFVPPVPGHDRAGCFVYRTIDDLTAIRAAAENATTGVVIGGGLLGACPGIRCSNDQIVG